ncbi:MAG: alpha-amylase family glycosyl hydrolase [Paracoccaceae bacterium]
MQIGSFARSIIIGAVLSACANTAPSAAEPVGKPSPSGWNEEIVYFVIPDRFADARPNTHKIDASKPGHFHGGDWKGLTQQLPYIDDLGVTALWITPIVDNIDGYVTGAGFPDWGYHGYWADDFEALDPRMGTEADLKALVDQAHARGMKVLVDVVFNHVGYDSPFIDARPDWVRTGGQCGQDYVTSCLFDLPDLRTDRADVRNHVLEAHAEWARRIGFDGYRIDTAKHVEPSMLAQNRTLVETRFGPDFLTLGEVWGADAASLSRDYFQTYLMTGGIDFSFRGAARDWLKGRSRTVAYSKGHLVKRHAHTDGAVLGHYLSSHDEPGLLHELEGDKDLFKLAVGLQMTSVGMPIIFYGEEVGRKIGDWPDNRSDMPWGDQQIGPGAGIVQDSSMRDHYRRLIAIRRAHPALAFGSYTPVAHERDVLVFARAWQGQTLFVAVNRGATQVAQQISLGKVRRTRWIEEMTGAQLNASDGKLGFDIPPKAIRIFAPKH